ncbi:MAG TPA: hypothetical protein VFF04_04850 [Candidatus Babeliales bacterium]|nr:hypothetical protein [Candidatus Babeliales bacterium]
MNNHIIKAALIFLMTSLALQANPALPVKQAPSKTTIAQSNSAALPYMKVAAVGLATLFTLKGLEYMKLVQPLASQIALATLIVEIAKTMVHEQSKHAYGSFTPQPAAVIKNH